MTQASALNITHFSGRTASDFASAVEPIWPFFAGKNSFKTLLFTGLPLEI